LSAPADYGGAMPVWDAEVTIDRALVHALLAEQFPELDASSARLLGEGWDNSAWVVEDEWVFRIPRRAIAVPLVEREIAVLPRLAPLVPLPVPEPVFIGRPSIDYPWPFFASRLLPGRELADAELEDRDRSTLGAELGRFLRTLHDVEIETVDPNRALPADPNGRADMGVRVPRVREQLGELERDGLWNPPDDVEGLLVHAEQLPPPGEIALVHGDLHVRHVLVDRGVASGVIDWGDVCVGDPAIDLHLVWSLLPRDARNAFFETYGSVGDERRLRARVLAMSLASMLALYAHDVGHASLERESLAGLERTLVD
jgi:aminoglycoside phosphotransferase (APT) family kinase protein